MLNLGMCCLTCLRAHGPRTNYTFVGTMHASESHRRHVVQSLLLVVPLLFSSTSVSLRTVTRKLTFSQHSLPNDQTGQILKSMMFFWVDTFWGTSRYLLHISFEQHRSLVMKEQKCERGRDTDETRFQRDSSSVQLNYLSVIIKNIFTMMW